MGGILLFQHVTDSKIDPNFFGNFISALQSFTSQIFDKGLTGYELEGQNYFVKKTAAALFIGSSDPEIKKKDVYEEFEKKIALFTQKFPI